MHYNVSQLMREPSGSRRAYDLDEAFQLAGDQRVCHVTGRVSLMRTDKGIWASARLNSRVQDICSLCLSDCEQPVHMTVEDEFFPVVDVGTGKWSSRPVDGEDCFYIDRNHILDLTETVRQSFVLSSPMKPVCGDDCAGICLTCGVNLNEGACTCDDSPRDRRWGSLLEIVSVSDEED